MENSIYQAPKTDPSGLPTSNTSSSSPLDPNSIVEFQRLRDKEAFEELSEIFEKAGISYKVGSNAPIFDLSTIGMERDVDVIVSVKIEDYIRAQEAAEAYYLTTELPDDHYLLTSSDDELLEIIAAPMEWSPFDVAHAKSLAEQRSIDLNPMVQLSEEPKQQLYHRKSYGRLLIIVIVIFSVVVCLLAAITD